ncbi:uncharacterized protein LOC122801263 [Protopterus annectens]|uniref:uncharacterized protein LOC122801263 n=1 Tax=Protopterus annectens TaxID=7888 RepID=UPI001CFACA2E|nr:uncharacterized protein LOC122801263 [Protopterus annectens]
MLLEHLLAGEPVTPEISLGAAVTRLSNKHQFPSFLRTMPSDTFQYPVLAHLVTYFSWTWIGIIASDNEYGLQGSQDLKMTLSHRGVCVAFTVIISVNFSKKQLLQITDIIRKSTVTVIVIYATRTELMPLMAEIGSQNITDKTWVATISWIISPVFSNKAAWKTLDGTFGLAVHRGLIPGFKEFIQALHPSTFPDDIFFKSFWEEAFDCYWAAEDNFMESGNINQTLSLCKGTENMKDYEVSKFNLFDFRYGYNTYKATLAIAHGLHDLISCETNSGPFANGTCANTDHINPWQELALALCAAMTKTTPNTHKPSTGLPSMQQDLPPPTTSQEDLPGVSLSGTVGTAPPNASMSSEFDNDGGQSEAQSGWAEVESDTEIVIQPSPILMFDTARRPMPTQSTGPTEVGQVHFDDIHWGVCIKALDSAEHVTEKRQGDHAALQETLEQQLQYKENKLTELTEADFLHTTAELKKTLQRSKKLQLICTKKAYFTIYLRFENGYAYISGSDLLHYVKNVLFEDTTGEKVFFDANGDCPAIYNILNWQVSTDGKTFKYVHIGYFDSRAPLGQNFFINTSLILWNGGNFQIPHSVCSESCHSGFRKAALREWPLCCFDCIPCPKGEVSNQSGANNCFRCPEDQWSNAEQNMCIQKSMDYLSYEEALGTSLTSCTVFFSLFTASIFCTFIKYRDTPVVKANNRELSYIILSSLFLCFLCPLLFIGQPQKVTCLLRQTSFGIIFSLCVSGILAKTITVVIAFKATKPDSILRHYIGPKTPYCIVLFGTMQQAVISIIWLVMSHPYPEMNMKAEEGKIILECKEGSVIMFYCMLGYLGLLSSVSFVMAFLARTLPDRFNEAKFISFSMIVFVSVWLSFIPAYLSTKGKYMVAVEIFAIVTSGAGIIICIFCPKCYVIILRPQINTKGYLTGNVKFSSK